MSFETYTAPTENTNAEPKAELEVLNIEGEFGVEIAYNVQSSAEIINNIRLLTERHNSSSKAGAEF